MNDLPPIVNIPPGTLPADLPGKSATNTADSASSASAKSKLRKVTEEFEAILISSWWQQMQQSFPASAEEEHEAGFNTMQELSYRALAIALAGRGGLGIAAMMQRQLAPVLARRPTPPQEVKIRAE